MNADPVIEMVGAGVGTDPGVAPLLSGVTWSVRSGEFWVVTGTHGAGKSLLLETMAGIQPCRGGDIRWFGNRPGTPEDSESGRARLGVRLGLVFDGGGRVFSSQTVAENLCIPLCYHSGCDWDEAFQRTAALQSELDLERFAHLGARSLAGGSDLLLLVVAEAELARHPLEHPRSLHAHHRARSVAHHARGRRPAMIAMAHARTATGTRTWALLRLGRHRHAHRHGGNRGHAEPVLPVHLVLSSSMPSRLGLVG